VSTWLKGAWSFDIGQSGSRLPRRSSPITIRVCIQALFMIAGWKSVQKA